MGHCRSRAGRDLSLWAASTARTLHRACRAWNVLPGGPKAGRSRSSGFNLCRGFVSCLQPRAGRSCLCPSQLSAGLWEPGLVGVGKGLRGRRSCLLSCCLSSEKGTSVSLRIEYELCQMWFMNAVTLEKKNLSLLTLHSALWFKALPGTSQFTSQTNSFRVIPENNLWFQNVTFLSDLSFT